jgi:DinB family protein
MALVAELEKIRAELDAVNLNAQKLVAGLSEEQLAQRPQPGRWSLAEIFVHLNLTAQIYFPEIDRAIEEGRAKGLTGQGPFKLDLMGKLFVKYLEPPYRMKTKAPGMIKPLLQGPAGEALPQFLRSQELVMKRLEAANGLDLRRVKFVSPLASVLKMNLLAPFAVLTAHQRRHLWQGWKIRGELGI